MSFVIYQGKRVVLPDGFVGPASILVESGKIKQVHKTYPFPNNSTNSQYETIDAGDYVLMPGVVDSHVHVNEPGRTQWEGFTTATKAAAAGGITTIVDMPLNSIPSTVTRDALYEKLEAADGQCYVDVGFWGGVVPQNQDELRPMINAGVCGFKCFLIHSGVDEFPHVTEDDLHIAMKKLQGTDSVLLFHAELDCAFTRNQKSDDPSAYKTFLNSRPDEMEVEAIKLVCKLCEMYRVPCHIVHLSSAMALPIIEEARRNGAPLTVETTHHYLTLVSDEIPEGATQYKCCPPIRSKDNQNILWEALKRRSIDMVVSDHSPCTADLKILDEGDFMKAWGGISSVQFGLSLFWTFGKDQGITLHDVVEFLCVNTAKVAGIQSRKGLIKEGYDADFVIWDPQGQFKIEEQGIQHKNKVTPYKGMELFGKVYRTVVRGQTVYVTGQLSDKPLGSFIYRKDCASSKL